MTPLIANLIALGAGIVIMLALVAVGALELAKLGLALKERGERYKTLPVSRYVDIAEAKVATASRRIAGLPGLVYRTNAALTDLANARAKVVAIATSPSAIWRLGEIIVTGK